MREIKFHGKCVMTGDWVIGSLMVFPNANPLIGVNRQESNEVPLIDWYKVDPETVGQYTDLKDSTRSETIPDGIEIFEGDILFDPVANEFYSVTWDENYANFFLQNTKELDVSKADYDFAEYELEVGNSLYIVGNITDNPELLES